MECRNSARAFFLFHEPTHFMRPIDTLLTAMIRLVYPTYNPAEQPSGQKSDKELAGQFLISPATFNNYKHAKRTPDPKLADTMAKAWAKHFREIVPDVKDRSVRLKKQGFSPEGNLVEEFKRHLGTAVLPTGYSSLIQDLFNVKGGGRLKVSSLNYGVFAGKPGSSFFERLTDRYFNQLGVNPDISLRNSKAEESLKSGETHLAMCYFASVNRVVNERFFFTPLRISLGAVSHRRYSHLTSGIARSLHIEHWKSDLNIRPIVVRGEVGYHHCIHTLGFNKNDDSMEILEEFDERALTTALYVACAVELEAGAPIPVVVVDEYTALGVFKGMGDDGLLSLPITAEASNSKSSARREMPQYLMSLACSRSREALKFLELLDESLRLFLSTEMNSTAHVLTEIFWRLEKEVFDATAHLGSWSDNDDYTNRRLEDHERQLIAREYALYTLSLDRRTASEHDTYPKHWQQILRQARELVMREMVSPPHDKETQNFIHSVLRLEPDMKDKPLSIEPQLSTQAQMELLTRYINQELDIDRCRGHYKEDIFDIIRAVMLGQGKPEEQILIQTITPGSKQWFDEFNAITEMLTQIGEMYAGLRDPLSPSPPTEPSKTEPSHKSLLLMPPHNVGKKISRRLSERLRDGFRRFGQIVLAIAETHNPGGKSPIREPAGIVCILEQPGCREDDRIAKDEDTLLDQGGQGDPVQLKPDERAHLERSCELRYLWVAKKYRHRNISQLLLGRALRWCQLQAEKDGAPKYDFVRSAALPQLSGAIEHLRQIGFTDRPPLEFDISDASHSRGRLIFEKDIHRAK